MKLYLSTLGACLALFATAEAQPRDRATMQAGAALQGGDADDKGAPGRITALRVHAPGSDDFAAFRGQIIIAEGGLKRTAYRWGGSACPGKDIEVGQVGLLADAFGAGWRVTPQWKPGAGSNKCLVGFSFSEP